MGGTYGHKHLGNSNYQSPRQHPQLHRSHHNGQAVLPPPHAPHVLQQRSTRSSYATDAGQGDSIRYEASAIKGQVQYHQNGNVSHHHNDGTLRSVATSVVSDEDRSLTKMSNEMIAHEIKFTKTKGCTPSTCACVLVAIVLISVGATSGVYFGRKFCRVGLCVCV